MKFNYRLQEIDKLSDAVEKLNTKIGNMDTRIGNMDARIGNMDTKISGIIKTFELDGEFRKALTKSLENLPAQIISAINNKS